jgi:hypothetical protein
VAAPLVYQLVRALPHTPWVKVDALLGFIVCLLPVAWLCWSVVGAPWRTGVLLAIFLGGTAIGFLLSWEGLGAIAVPFKVAAAVSAGRLVGRQMTEAWWLAAVAALALVADSWSVFAGPTRVIVEKAPGVLTYLLVPFAAFGGGPGLGLGMSDFFFFGLFLAGAIHTGLRVRATFGALLAGLLGSVLLALTLGRALPALPLMSLAFVLVNADRLWTSARWSWQERK